MTRIRMNIRWEYYDGLWARNFIKKKLQHRFFPLKFMQFLRTPILKNICERLLLFFHYNSHHHYHHHYFHYHCKMHLYYLSILPRIPLDCNMILCLFQLNFVFFLIFWHIFFSSVTPSFSFFTPSKRTQNSFTTSRQILDVLFILIFISKVICTSFFTLTWL